MDDDIVIKVENVSKKYCKSLNRSMTYGIKDILRNSFGLSVYSQKLRKDEFWAVDDVSFELKKGETLGIIGLNGSGKTTLLKMLNGIFWPDKGKITIKSKKIGALIEVGAGFHPLLTGRENIYINGAILGMTKKELDKKFDSIVEFADIGDFLDVSVKNYSNGMYVRLGFSIMAHQEPEILLVDEVLAVGDIVFQSKCFNTINKLCENGTTVVFVSHSLEAIVHYAKKILYIDNGKLVFLGNPQEACEQYTLQQSRKIAANSIVVTASRGYQIPPSSNLKELNFKMVDSLGKEKTEVMSGEEVKFNFSFLYSDKISSLQISIIIYQGGVYLIGIDSLIDGFKISINNEAVKGILKIPRMTLTPGKYTAVLALTDGGKFLLRGQPIDFYVVSKRVYHGIIDLYHEWDIQTSIKI